MHRTKSMGAVLLLGGLLLGGTAAADPSAQAIVNTCAACHGTDGVSSGPAMPNIAGLSRNYLVKSLRHYRSGKRGGTIMVRIARGLSDTEIIELANYLSKGSFVTHVQPYDARRVATGHRLHRIYCSKCHGLGGSSSLDDTGILAGQWADYLRITLHNFVIGNRPMPFKMRVRLTHVVADNGDEAINNLIAFYLSEASKAQQVAEGGH